MIADEFDGRRFDQVLAEMFPDYSRSRLQVWIKAGDALLDDVGDVVMTADAVDRLPVPIRQAPIEYPASLQRAGVTGRVLLEFTVNTSGSVTQVRVLESDPPETFDAIAVRAVRQWQFQPCLYDGAPVACSVEQPFDFDLDR